MRLEQLEYLMKIGKYNNMTKAAENLHISQPALSESIKRLERELGITLLERYYNGVSLTEAGIIVMETAEQIFQQVDMMQDRLSALCLNDNEKIQEICVDVPAFFGDTYLFGYWKACKDEMGKILQAKVRDSKEIIERVSEKQLHAGIVLLEEQVYQELQYQYHELMFQLLYRGKLQIVLEKNHPLAMYEVIPAEEVVKYPLLALKNECIPVLDRLKPYGVPRKFEESGVYSMPLHFIEEEKGTFLISSVLLKYFKENPFHKEALVVKDLDIIIPAHLFIVIDKTFSQQTIGQQILRFTERYFLDIMNKTKS